MLDKNFNTSIQMPMFTDSIEAILENEDLNGDLLIPTNFLIQHQRQQQTGFYLFCKLDYRIFRIILANANFNENENSERPEQTGFYLFCKLNYRIF